MGFAINFTLFMLWVWLAVFTSMTFVSLLPAMIISGIFTVYFATTGI